MVVIKYRKIGLGAFIGQEEMLGCWDRIMNRAEMVINKDFTFKLFMPASIGIESLAEYLIVNTPLDETKVKNKIHELFPDWIEVVECYNIVDSSELESYEVRELLSISLSHLKDNENKIIAAFDALKEDGKVIDFRIEENCVKVAVSSILSNGMCDIIHEILEQNKMVLDYGITRDKLLLELPDRLQNTDEFLEEKQKETRD